MESFQKPKRKSTPTRSSTARATAENDHDAARARAAGDRRRPFLSAAAQPATHSPQHTDGAASPGPALTLFWRLHRARRRPLPRGRALVRWRAAAPPRSRQGTRAPARGNERSGGRLRSYAVRRPPQRLCRSEKLGAALSPSAHHRRLCEQLETVGEPRQVSQLDGQADALTERLRGGVWSPRSSNAPANAPSETLSPHGWSSSRARSIASSASARARPGSPVNREARAGGRATSSAARCPLPRSAETRSWCSASISGATRSSAPGCTPREGNGLYAAPRGPSCQHSGQKNATAGRSSVPGSSVRSPRHPGAPRVLRSRHCSHRRTPLNR